MEKEYLTIKEVSQYADLSYQAIYQRTKTSLKKYVVLVEGRTLLRHEVLSEFNGDRFSEGVQPDFESTNEEKLNEDSIPLHNTNEEELLTIIKELRAELRDKDEQIKKQTEQIINLSERVTTLFENSQKLQLQTSYLLSDNNNKIQADEEGARPYEEVIEVPQKKKSWFSRFFK